MYYRFEWMHWNDIIPVISSGLVGADYVNERIVFWTHLISCSHASHTYSSVPLHHHVQPPSSLLHPLQHSGFALHHPLTSSPLQYIPIPERSSVPTQRSHGRLS